MCVCVCVCMHVIVHEYVHVCAGYVEEVDYGMR